MIRLAALFSLLLVRVALAEDAALPESARPEPLSEARRALIEKAEAPLQAARLPTFGVDPLRRVPGTAVKTTGVLQAPAPRAPHGGQLGAQRARDAADHAAERAAGGHDGRDHDGHGRDHDGHGHDHGGHDGGGLDGHDHDGPGPGGGTPPPPHPP